MLLRGRPTGQTVWNAHGAIIEGSGADAAVGVRGLVSHQGSGFVSQPRLFCYWLAGRRHQLGFVFISGG